jgi:hypothetical protein
MGMGMPMGEDFVTIIMGLDDPCEPGMHGKLEEPCPTEDAVTLVTKIRDMCDEWLRSAGKGADTDTEQQPTEVGDTSEEE